MRGLNYGANWFTGKGEVEVDASHFAEAIEKLTQQLTSEYTDIVKEETYNTAMRVNTAIYQHAPDGKRKGASKYKNHFAVSVAYENKTNLRMQWHVKEPEYRLTHLLEYGHAIRRVKGGTAIGWARAIHHIGYGFDERDKLPDYIMSRLNNL